MTARVLLASGAVVLALTLAGCRGQAAPVTPTGAGTELTQIQTTLDAIDSELAGDGSS